MSTKQESEQAREEESVQAGADALGALLAPSQPQPSESVQQAGQQGGGQ